jgi:hypothetical protein
MLAEVTSMEEAKEVNVEDNEDINIDVEDEVDVDDVSKKSEIEVDSELAGEDADISAILGLLTKANPISASSAGLSFVTLIIESESTSSPPDP